jgi:hypothetical protein
VGEPAPPRPRNCQDAIEQLRRAIDEALASGISDQTIDDIWRAAEERHAEKRQDLP